MAGKSAKSRRLVFSDGKSNKFWNIDLRGSSYTITFGRIGTAGDLIGINGEGEPVEKVPSALGVAQPLVGPSHQAIQESPTEQVWAKSSQWESKLKKANSLRFLSLIIDFQVFNCSPKNFENAFSTRSLPGHTVHLSSPF